MSTSPQAEIASSSFAATVPMILIFGNDNVVFLYKYMDLSINQSYISFSLYFVQLRKLEILNMIVVMSNNRKKYNKSYY